VFGAGALVLVLWVLVGYAMAFGATDGVGYLGLPGVLGLDPASIGLGAQLPDLVAATGVSPELGRAAFFASVALSAVAVVAVGAGPVRRVAWLVFAGAWSLLVLFPQLGWVFDLTFTGSGTEGGWLASGLRSLIFTGFLDFSGASAVHVSGGAAALALLLVLRRGPLAPPGEGDRAPADEGFLLAGASVALVGALAAAGGAEGAADGYAALSVITAIAAGSAGALTGAALEWFDPRAHATAAGVRGLVAGLAASAAAGGSVAPLSALVLGALAGAVCTAAGRIAARRGAPAPVHAVIAHLGGGAVGLLFLGILATDTGLAYSGRFFQLIAQAIGLVAVFTHSFLVAALLGLVLDRTLGFRDLTPAPKRPAAERSGRRGPESRGSRPSRARP
ncbi:MAG TPA: hypothetical protein VIL55_12210, partial [Naasia sp.]